MILCLFSIAFSISLFFGLLAISFIQKRFFSNIDEVRENQKGKGTWIVLIGSLFLVDLAFAFLAYFYLEDILSMIQHILVTNAGNGEKTVALLIVNMFFFTWILLVIWFESFVSDKLFPKLHQKLSGGK